MRVGTLAAILVAASILACGPAGNSGEPELASKRVPSGTVLRADRPVPGQYLVVFNEGQVARDAVDAQAADLAGRHGGRVFASWRHAVRGFAEDDQVQIGRAHV